MPSRTRLPSCLASHDSTVVSQWVLCQLAMRPEYLVPLRAELADVLEEDETGSLRLTARSLRAARLMDSFIREVMRLKGDTISAMRFTTEDVALGDVVIPKGACAPTPAPRRPLLSPSSCPFRPPSFIMARQLTRPEQATSSPRCPPRCTRTLRCSESTRASSTASSGPSVARRRS